MVGDAPESRVRVKFHQRDVTEERPPVSRPVPEILPPLSCPTPSALLFPGSTPPVFPTLPWVPTDHPSVAVTLPLLPTSVPVGPSLSSLSARPPVYPVGPQTSVTTVHEWTLPGALGLKAPNLRPSLPPPTRPLSAPVTFG